VFPLAAGVLVSIAWQLPFFIYALAFPVALIVYAWFDEPFDRSRVASGNSIANDNPKAVDVPTDRDGNRGDQLRSLLRLASRPRVAALVIGRGLPMIAWVGFLTYNSALVVETGLGTAAEAGLLVTVNSAMLAVGGSQAGRITVKFNSRLWPLVISNVALGVGLALVALAPTLVIAALGSAILGIGFGVSMSLYRSVVTGLAPPTLRGGLVSIAESGGRLASTITPIGMGILVGTLTSEVGFEWAVRWTAIGVGGSVAVSGQCCLVIARFSPKTAAEHARST
jgi:predicted MFS family arabinose efflux permease